MNTTRRIGLVGIVSAVFFCLALPAGAAEVGQDEGGIPSYAFARLMIDKGNGLGPNRRFRRLAGVRQ